MMRPVERCQSRTNPRFVAGHAMAQVSKVELHADDRGLASCMSVARVHHDWLVALKATHKIETLDDFVYMVERGKWEQSVKELVDAVPALKEDRLILARMRSAYETGYKASESAQSVSSKIEDLDEPLPEAQSEQLQRDWVKADGLTVEAHLDQAGANSAERP